MKRIFVCLFLVLLLLPIEVHAQDEVIYTVDGMDDVVVENIAYRVVDDITYTMDVYYPSDMDDSSALPLVILVNGFRDSSIAQFMGSDMKDIPGTVSWGRLLAASGLIAVAYESEQADDLEVLVAFIQENAESLSIDAERIGLMASSSNPPVAISYAMQDERDFIRAAVFYYGSMMTPDGELDDALNSECHQYGCYAPDELPVIEQLRDDLPTLMVRAEFDYGENGMIDHYLMQALAYNVPITFINFTGSSHGFDTGSNELIIDEARAIVASTVDFLLLHLDD